MNSLAGKMLDWQSRRTWAVYRACGEVDWDLLGSGFRGQDANTHYFMVEDCPMAAGVVEAMRGE